MPKTNIPTKAYRIGKGLDALKSISRFIKTEVGSCRNVGTLLSCSPATACGRMRDPDKLTLGELIMAAVRLDCEGTITLRKGENTVEIRF